MSGALRLPGNPFYTPWFLQAVRHLPGGAHGFVPGLPGLPVRKMALSGGKAFEALITPYSPLTLPRDNGPFSGEGLRYLRLAMLPGEANGEDLLAGFRERGAKVHLLKRHERAMVASELDADAYLQAALSQKRRKRAREARNRLARLGDLRFSSAYSGAERLSHLEIFKRLEVAGWKGRKGTAFTAQKAANAFLDALAAAAPPEALGIHLLYAGGTPVAAGIVLHDCGAAWYWKTAYSEKHAHASPGVVFTLELTRHLMDERGIRIIDSCATADHPMINGLWAERLPMLDVLVDFTPSRPALLPPVLKAGIGAKARAKTLARRGA